MEDPAQLLNKSLRASVMMTQSFLEKDFELLDI